MKVQCSCGAKYAFDVTSEMARNPIRFVCQNCGQDSSEFVNELIRRELASSAVHPGAPAVPEAVPPVEAPRAGTSQIRIQPASPAEGALPAAGAAHFCAKHPGQVITHRCLVCAKPICPKCMELFGYVCSPLCRGKAEERGIEIPVYQGKKAVIESRHWRKVGVVAGAIAAITGGLLGFWFWYAWIGSVPKPVFSVRFPEPAYSGESVACGINQIVFLHGTILARHDMKEKREVWSRALIEPSAVTNAAIQRWTEVKNAEARLPESDSGARTPSEGEWIDTMKRVADGSLRLHVRAQNVWVIEPVTLLGNDLRMVRYDWDTGRPLQQILLGSGVGGMSSQGDELLLTVNGKGGRQAITRINLVSGEWRVDKIGLPPAPERASASGKNPDGKPRVTTSKGQALAGLPAGVSGGDEGTPLDPAKVAQQVQGMPLAERIALPAILSSQLHQERISAELNDETQAAPRRPGVAPEKELPDPFRLIPCRDGYVQLSVRVLEERHTTRRAMKEPPAKSVMEGGDLTTSQTGEAANEILNEMQRSRGGDTVTEDESRYQVTVRRPEVKEAPDWVGEVVGRPSFFPLNSVNVVAGGKMLVVLDRMDRKLWQATLNYNVAQGFGSSDEESAPFGQGPCVEQGDALYVFDEAVLTAFDLATGKVRWRLPTVGVVGLFFDGDGMMYVNTTTASPESIRYSRQIDVTKKTSVVVMKIDPRTGKTLWAVTPGGFVGYVSGKFIYALSAHAADESENSRFHTGLEIPSCVLIQRVNPRNGHVMWVHQEQRAPLAVHFNRNSIQLVFKKEVEVLRFFSL